MGIDYGDDGWWWQFFWVILVVKNWCLCLSFGGRWLCGLTGEREREREEGEREDKS